MPLPLQIHHMYDSLSRKERHYLLERIDFLSWFVLTSEIFDLPACFLDEGLPILNQEILVFSMHEDRISHIHIGAYKH
jgi:hypothetical protein